MESSPVSHDRLVWSRRDIERRFGFSGSRYTRVGSVLPAVFAIAVTVAFFGAMFAIGSNPWVDMFIRRGWTPLVIVFFAVWSVMILFLKRSKLRLQRKALRLSVIPEEMNFQVSVSTAGQVLQRLYEVSDDPKHFVLLHRIEVGLSSMQNLSRVNDVGEILRTQSEHDESVMETSFNLIRGLVWAIPILGFIGTVSGLSLAIGGFGRVLSQTDDPSKLIDALKGVTGGLATAFETTLLALIAALLVQMAMTFQKKREEEFLDECTEYCQREISRRLRTSADDLETRARNASSVGSQWRDRQAKSSSQAVAQAKKKPKTKTSNPEQRRGNKTAGKPAKPKVDPASQERSAKPDMSKPIAAAAAVVAAVAPEALPVDDLPPEVLPVDTVNNEHPVEIFEVEALPADVDDYAEVVEVLPDDPEEDDIDAGVKWD